jgi:hypothetical protein
MHLMDIPSFLVELALQSQHLWVLPKDVCDKKRALRNLRINTVYDLAGCLPEPRLRSIFRDEDIALVSHLLNNVPIQTAATIGSRRRPLPEFTRQTRRRTEWQSLIGSQGASVFAAEQSINGREIETRGRGSSLADMARMETSGSHGGWIQPGTVSARSWWAEM